VRIKVIDERNDGFRNFSIFDVWIIVQNDVEQRTVYFQVTIIVDQSHFSKSVHEKAHARSRRSDHLGKRFLGNFCDDPLRASVMAEIRQQKQRARQSFLARKCLVFPTPRDIINPRAHDAGRFAAF
jgi:hypothetical protein